MLKKMGNTDGDSPNHTNERRNKIQDEKKVL